MDTPLFDHLTTQDFKRIYEPAEDTFLLLDALEDDLEYLDQTNPGLFFEIGSGSGIIITAIAKRFPNSLCLSTDINHWACDATRKTARHNGTSVDTIQTNILDNVKPNLVDVLFFNPPYVVTTDMELNDKQLNDVGFNVTDQNLVYSWAGGMDGRRVIDILIQKLDSILSKCGVLYLLVLKENNPKDIIHRLLHRNFKAEVFRERRIVGEYLYILKVIRC